MRDTVELVENFNTSYVSVKRSILGYIKAVEIYFNTSYVSVKQLENEIEELKEE